MFGFEAGGDDVAVEVQRQVVARGLAAVHLQQVQRDRQAQVGMAQQRLGAGEHHAGVGVAHRCRGNLGIGIGLEEAHLRRVFLAAFPVALEVALLVHHQGVVRHGLLGPAAVLGQVDAAALGFHVEEAGRAVVGHHWIAVVVEQPVELVEVAMAHALHRVLLHQRLAAFAVHAQDRRPPRSPSGPSRSSIGR